jgi:hypothetical protein
MNPEACRKDRAESAALELIVTGAVPRDGRFVDRLPSGRRA